MVRWLFRVLHDLGKGIGVAGSEWRDVGYWPYVGCGVLMPSVVWLDCTFFVPSSASFGLFLVGMTVLNAEVAVEEDQGEDQEEENGNAYSDGYNGSVW